MEMNLSPISIGGAKMNKTPASILAVAATIAVTLSAAGSPGTGKLVR